MISMSPLKRHIAVTAMVMFALVMSVFIMAEEIDAEEEGISIMWAEYLPDEGKVSFSGTSSSDYVNVMVVGTGFESQVKPCQVKDGSFSGAFAIGDVEPGSYRLVVKSSEADKTLEFEVVGTPIVINSVTFDSSDARVTVMGKLYSTDISVLILDAPGNQNYNARIWIDNDNSFVSYFYLGRLTEGGTYQIKTDASGPIIAERTYTDSTSDIEETVDSNVLRDNGSTLVRFTGEVEQYKIPSSVTKILDGAFKNCSIGTFILDRDVQWEIKKYDGMIYPFQRSNLSNLVIKEGVTVIPNYLFAKTDISSVELPSSVTTVGTKSFYDCDSMVSLTVRDNNCLTYLGDYSFSHSSGLMTVSFGSSADGYKCDLGMAAFLYSSNVRNVILHDDFYLRSIGALCFTKQLKVSGSTGIDPIYAINFNSTKGITIPKEVEEIGNLAFSATKSDSTIVPDIAPNLEPVIGTYVYYSDGYVTYGGIRSLIGDNLEIIFEYGSQVTSIGIAAFGGYQDVTLIDLSECTKLTVIQKSAFGGCLKNGILRLPPNIEELYLSFENSTGHLEGQLPDSLRICDNALGTISGVMAVGEHSALEYWSDDKYGAITELDLAGAGNLTYVSTGCEKVILPAGVYEGNINVGKLKDKTIGPVVEEDTITITEMTSFLNWNMLSTKTIICACDNQYFKAEQGAVYFENNGVCKLLQIEESDSFILKSNTEVRQGIIGQALMDLTLGSGSKLDSGSLSSCDSLQTLKIIGSVDVMMLESALEGINAWPTIIVSCNASDSDIVKLSMFGQVLYYTEIDGCIVNLPATFEDDILHYETSSSKTLIVDKVLDGMLVTSSGATVSLSGQVLVLRELQSECYIWFVSISELSDTITITLNADGGSFGDQGTSDLIIRSGTTVSSIAKIPTKNLHEFKGWGLVPNGARLSDDHVLSDGDELYALWESRGPKIIVDTEAAIVYSGGSKFDYAVIESGSSITLTVEPKDGYELFNWVVNGVIKGSATQSLTYDSISEDLTISLTFRYYSSSSGLNGISNRYLPTIDESDDLVMVSELGGVINGSMSIWEGPASVPLVVDNRIYFRAGPWLYAAESDTGHIIASVASEEAKSYYHQLGYGGGVIIDYKTSKVYDLDLNQLFVLPVKVTGVEYYNGLFYTSGADVYVFTAMDDDPNSIAEEKTMNFIGHINNVYTSYGFSKSVFVDHYMYRVIVDGKERGIAAMDLETGIVQSRYLESIRSMFLDDAWISYHDGCVYLPGYVSGLFGEVATEGYDTLAFIHVDGLNFGVEEHWTFDGKTSWPSEMLFYGDKAYICVSGSLYCFDIIDGKISGNPRSIYGINHGHGSMVMEVGYEENGEDVLYFYFIPYQSVTNGGMTIVEERNGEFSMHVVYGLPKNYNSQAVRADLDGRMIWYNDSGHIYNYTTPEKNVYYFFIEDGEHAQWYEAHGRNAAEALRSLGSDIISLDDYKRVTSVFGKAVDKPTIKALQQNKPSKVESNLMSYSWIILNDLYDRSYDTCHYYRIIASGNGNSTFSYLDDDGTVSTYTFQNNIGDGRKVLGKMLVPGNDCAKIRFFDGDTELTDLAMIYSKSAGASWNLPSMIRNGTDVVWTTSSGDAVTSLVQATAGKTDIALYGTWPVSSADLSKDVTVSMEGNVKTVTVALSEQEGTVYLKSVVRDGSGFTEETYELKESESWTKTMTVSEGTEGMLLYLVRSSEQSFADSIGCALLTEGAGL